MKIHHWIESYLPKIGGGEILLSKLARAQLAEGHSVCIVTNLFPGMSDVEEMDGVLVRRFSFSRVLEDRDMEGLLHIVKDVSELSRCEAPDILHLHSQQAMAFFFLRLPRKSYGQAIYTAHDGNYPEKGKGSSLVGQVVERVEAMTAPSEYSRRIHAEAFPEAVEKMRCIMNSLPGCFEPPQPLAVPELRVVALGRMVSEKGFDVFVEAIRLLGDGPVGVSFELIGDGPERSVLEALIEKYELSSRVHLTGWVAPSDVFKSIGKASMVVVPSRWQEPFGLVALQAMQCGRAVVASAVGGLSEVVEDGATGLLVPPDDSVALAKAMGCLLRDPDRLRVMGEQGLKRAETRFSWARCVEQYDQLYRELSI